MERNSSSNHASCSMRLAKTFPRSTSPGKKAFTYSTLGLIAITIVSSVTPSVIAANINHQVLELNDTQTLNAISRLKRDSNLTPDPAAHDLDLGKVKDFMDYLAVCYFDNFLLAQNPKEYSAMAFYAENQNKVDDLGILNIASEFKDRETVLNGETLVHHQTNEFKASGSNDETASTLAYAYDVTNTYTFKFGEKISVKAGFKVLALAALEINAELNLEQTYTTTKTIRLSAPSQKTVVKAHHKKEVTYSVYKGDSTLNGVLKVRIDPDQIITIRALKNLQIFSNQYQAELTFRGLVNAVRGKGYGHLFNSNRLITQEGDRFYLNVPAELQTNTNRLVVNFSDDIRLN